jgi:Xaa-Pro aminopeptidase
MAEHDLVALVAATPDNVGYLTGHHGWAQQVYRGLESFGVLTAGTPDEADLVCTRQDNTYYAGHPGNAARLFSYGGTPALVVPDGYVPATAEEAVYLDLHRSAAQHRSAADALVAALTGRSVRSGRVGVDMRGCSEATRAQLAAALPGCTFVDASDLFFMIRLVKTPAELDRMRAAAQLNEDALGVALADLKPGATEAQVAALWRAEVARAGGTWLWFHFGSGTRSSFIFPPSPRRLESGDLFVIDSGLVHDNYFADTGICGSIGEPGERARREWAIVESAFARGLAQVREGVTAQEIYDAVVAGFHEQGWASFRPPHVGHTIGAEAREFPYTLSPESRFNRPFLPPTSEIPLPANATINVEIPVGELGYGGYQIEKTLVVTPDGYEELIDQPRGMLVVGA